MLFSKARYDQKKATRTMKFHHTKLSQQVSSALELTTNNNCLTETDVEAAFGCRRHTSTSEPYYWEQVYELHNRQDIIPIDEHGQAHTFTLIKEQKQNKNQHSRMSHIISQCSSRTRHHRIMSQLQQWGHSGRATVTCVR